MRCRRLPVPSSRYRLPLLLLLLLLLLPAVVAPAVLPPVASAFRHRRSVIRLAVLPRPVGW